VGIDFHTPPWSSFRGAGCALKVDAAPQGGTGGGQGVPKGKWDLGLGTGNGPAHASARLITPFMQLGSGMKTGIKN